MTRQTRHLLPQAESQTLGGEPSHGQRLVPYTQDSCEQGRRHSQFPSLGTSQVTAEGAQGFDLDSTSRESKVLQGAPVTREITADNLAEVNGSDSNSKTGEQLLHGEQEVGFHLEDKTYRREVAAAHTIPARKVFSATARRI